MSDFTPSKENEIAWLQGLERDMVKAVFQQTMAIRAIKGIDENDKRIPALEKELKNYQGQLAFYREEIQTRK